MTAVRNREVFSMPRQCVVCQMLMVSAWVTSPCAAG
nr:MAG TPA: hypothetical protein [Caudoviricetes sp.]